MSILKSLVLIDFDKKESIHLNIPGSTLELKNPASAPFELKGALDYIAPNMLHKMDSFKIQSYEGEIYYELLRCCWPLWHPGNGNPVNTSLSIHAIYLQDKSKGKWNFLDATHLKEYIIDQWRMIAEDSARSFDLEIEDYCKEFYFPKLRSDFAEIEVNGSKFMYSINGGLKPPFEETSLYTPISSNALIKLTFNISVDDCPLKSHPELNDLKHKIVTDYLKHVIIEPRPMTETAPA